ncbi:hypothetical protein [Streptomyces sp. SYSU K21746]
MTPAEVEQWRQIELDRLEEAESAAQQLATATGRDMTRTLARIDRTRRRVLGTAAPVRIEVQVPVGANREAKRQAVITAYVAMEEAPVNELGETL